MSLLNNDHFSWVVAFPRMNKQVGKMSSGTPVCPVCQKEHNDTSKSFDTLTLCNKCNPQPGMVIPTKVIKKMYARFNVDCMAFYFRKEILTKYMKEYILETNLQ